MARPAGERRPIDHDVDVTEPSDQVDPQPAEPDPASFRDVDTAATDALVEMMDATDRWDAVRAARSWVLDRASVDPTRPALDVGCGPGTFGADARARGWRSVDLDRSAAMAHVARRRGDGSPGVLGGVGALPFATASFALVHCERVLQWADDPAGALDELWRVTAPEGHLAVTDTDWGTLAVDDPSGGDALSGAALGWVTHPRLARTLPRRLHDLGAEHVDVRSDVVTLTTWDPDDPAQHDGPPGLPLHSIAAGAHGVDVSRAEAAVASIADAARHGRFFAALTIVTAVARR